MPFDVEEVLSKLSNGEKAALLSGKSSIHPLFNKHARMNFTRRQSSATHHLLFVWPIFSRFISLYRADTYTGVDFWHTYPIPEHNVPSIRVSDGPNGIRGTKWFAGVLAACLPCGTALGATWDKKLLRKSGKLIGDECVAKGAHCWLGPTINMQRSPLGGRGFESFAEDPHLSGILASEMIQGCESTGVTSTVKHFVCNDQEHERRAVDSIITPRALREIYLRPFQIVARDASPGAMMTSYNKVNGIHVAQDPVLLEDLVRKEWGWDPMMMSDW